MKRQNQPIRSLEKVGEDLMKHGYVVGRIGVDGTRKGLIELSKVVFHRVLPPSQIPKVGWRKSNWTVFVVRCSWWRRTSS